MKQLFNKTMTNSKFIFSSSFIKNLSFNFSYTNPNIITTVERNAEKYNRVSSI